MQVFTETLSLKRGKGVKLRIVVFEPRFLTPRPNADSGLVQLHDQVKYLSKNPKNEVVVLTEKTRDYDDNEKYRIHPIKGNLSNLSERFSASKRYIPHLSNFFSPDIINTSSQMIKKEIKPDIIYSCGTSFSSMFSSRIGKLTSVPTVHYVFHHTVTWEWWKEPISTMDGYKVPLSYIARELFKNSIREIPRRRFILKKSFKNITQIISSSDSMRNKILDGFSIDTPVIYPGVEIPRSMASAKDYKTILYLGHLWQGRGILDLLSAFSSIIKEDQSAKLIVAPNNIHKLTETHFNKLIKKERLEKNIEIKGVVNDVFSELFSNSDIVCLPYRDRPSIKLFESMSAGKAVVTTNVGYSSEIIDDEFNGLLAKPADSNGLSEKILSILGNAKKIRMLGLNARKTCQANYDISKKSNELSKIFEGVCDKR